MSTHDLPHVNACLNSLTTVFLLAGYLFVRNGKIKAHRICMTAALSVSALFLIGYLTHKFTAGPKLFPQDLPIRPLYLAILLTHTILAVINLPFIIRLVFLAAKDRIDEHKRLARWVWPSWMYVSVTGVIVYWMLYHWYA